MCLLNTLNTKAMFLHFKFKNVKPNKTKKENYLMFSIMNFITLKVTLYVWPSPLTIKNKFLAISDGPSSLRVFVEPESKDSRECEEDLERLEWFEEFSWRETKRKLDFKRWQNYYLANDATALRRKAEREQAEVHKRHQEARKKFLKVRTLFFYFIFEEFLAGFHLNFIYYCFL